MAPDSAIETRTSHYWERPDGIIIQRIKPDVTQSLADARENTALFERLAGDEKRPILVDMRAKFTTGPGVREFYASPEAGRRVLAMTLLIGSQVGRLIGNLYMTVAPPRFPTRMFTSEEESIAWLLRMAKGAGRRAG